MRNDNDSICEQLESRRLLSAALVDGVLKVVGTEGNDKIYVAGTRSGGPIVVQINGTKTTFARGPVHRIEVSGLGGDDVLNAGSLFHPAGVLMKGGMGNDSLVGSNQTDHLYGGNGDDSIYGYRGSDWLYGQGGVDHLWDNFGNNHLFGGDANDLLDGGPGNDTLMGEGGKDVLYGKEGADLLNGGRNDDVVVGGAGVDLLIGGSSDYLRQR